MRKAFVMSVNPGQETEYERRHRPIWPELEAILKAPTRADDSPRSTEIREVFHIER